MRACSTIFTLCFISVFSIQGQSADILFGKALDLINSGEIIEALPLLEQASELDRNNPLILFELGYCYLSIMEYKKGVVRLNEYITFDSTNAKAFIYRGYCKEKLLYYNEALQDYEISHSLDTLDGEALFRLGLLKEKFDRKEEACGHFKKAFETGYERAKHKTKRCQDSTYLQKAFNEILALKAYSTDKKYGFTPKKPVKVGMGSSGGPANQRAYLDLLRDINGKPVWYERAGSCCPYKSKNGLFGSALLDEYIVYFTNEENEQVSTSIYISFYDYEEPKVLKGFKTITRD